VTSSWFFSRQLSAIIFVYCSFILPQGAKKITLLEFQDKKSLCRTEYCWQSVLQNTWLIL